MKISFAALLVTTVSVYGQTAAPRVEFEVASVKPTADLKSPGQIVHMAGERGYHGVNMALLQYIRVAYQVRDDQISAPEWLGSEYIDVDAKADHSCTADELHQMLQHLLEDRFQIRLHREIKMANGYELRVEAGGPRMTEHDAADHRMLPLLNGPGIHQGVAVAMQYLAFFLSAELGQTVVDKTGLTGHYDFQVTWGYNGPMQMAQAPPPPGAGAGPGPGEMPMAAAPSGPTVFEALKKQLGLRLERAKVPVEHLVIDHIAKLSEN